MKYRLIVWLLKAAWALCQVPHVFVDACGDAGILQHWSVRPKTPEAPPRMTIEQWEEHLRRIHPRGGAGWSVLDEN